jgi:membrane protease YdiL (CAAX protease family)
LAAGLQFAGVTFPSSTELALLAGVGAATAVLVRFVHHKPVRAVGLWFAPNAASDIGLGVSQGILMITCVAAVLFAMGYVQIEWTAAGTGDTVQKALLGLLLFAVMAAFEELLFRGYPFQVLIMGMTMLPALLLTSVLFALGHLGNPSVTPMGVINVGLAGVWLSFAYFKTRRLWLPWGLHLGWNFAQGTMLGLPTSGLIDDRIALCRATVSGPEWLTGGGFGPEGGVLTTVALIASTWFILKSTMFRSPQGVITLDSLEDVMQAPGVHP